MSTGSGVDVYHPTLTEYYEALKSARPICKSCSCPLIGQFRMYDHDGGYPVYGYKEKQWLYTECPKCDYQWALAKIMPRRLLERLSNPHSDNA
jgi:hypothetical protein